MDGYSHEVDTTGKFKLENREISIHGMFGVITEVIMS